MVNGMKEAELKELVKGISSADLKAEVKKRGRTTPEGVSLQVGFC